MEDSKEKIFLLVGIIKINKKKIKNFVYVIIYY